MQKIIHPLKPIEEGDVNWKILESNLNFQFPESFKDFISIYGSSIWFDTYSLFYTEAKSQEEIDEYKVELQAKLDDIRFDMYDEESMEDLEYGVTPSSPGLLPFMIDYNGCTYLWLMTEESPEKWPVLYWKMGPTHELGQLSLGEMFLRWLKREEPMFSAWGDSDKWRDTSDSGFTKVPLRRR